MEPFAKYLRCCAAIITGTRTKGGRNPGHFGCPTTDLGERSAKCRLARDLLRRPIHENELAIHRFSCRQQLVNPSGLTFEVGIICTKDDAGMARPFCMETAKVPAIECQNDSSMGNRIPQHRCVGIALIRLTVLEDCQDVVSQPAQFFDDREGNVFVRIQPSHFLRHFVLDDLSIDFLPVEIVIRPSIAEVFGT